MLTLNIAEFQIKTRLPGTAKLTTATVAKILALTCSKPPGQVTHWTGRAMAEATGVSPRSVQRIWYAHHLQPHRPRTFKRSSDPDFAEKVEDIVGLYMDPPMHTVVLSIDEKSQIQALDRTQPGLPLKPGKCGTMTHDYKRNGALAMLRQLVATCDAWPRLFSLRLAMGLRLRTTDAPPLHRARILEVQAPRLAFDQRNKGFQIRPSVKTSSQ